MKPTSKGGGDLAADVQAVVDGSGPPSVTPAATAPSAEVSGVVLAHRYHLGDVLGHGGTSVVYRGYDDVLDRAVAVKMLAQIDDLKHRRQLRAEARASGRLNHPRIAQVFDYGETEGEGGVPVPYIVMELVNGESLAHRLADHPVLGWPEATGIAAQIAQALSAAHGRGLVHRDIKPGNVIITDEGVKLVDFGISATVGSRDADDDGRLLGTPSYVAPERIADAPVVPASDMYSLGVLLYRMLTGTVPWTVETRTQQLEAHAFIDPAPLPPIDGLPAEVIDLYRACVTKDPHTRPTSSEAAAMLVRVGGREATVAPSVDIAANAGRSPAARTRPLIRPHQPATEPAANRGRGFTLAFSLGVIAVAVLAIVWATGGVPAPATADDPAACDTALTVLQDSGSSFTAALRITNTGPTSFNGWALTFAFTGQQSIQPNPGTGDQTTVTPTSGTPYTVTMSQSGPNVVAHSDAGQQLAPGTGAVLSLHARYLGTNLLPTAFDLNGHTCRTQITGATVVPTLHPLAGTTTPTAPARTASPKPHSTSAQRSGPGNPGKSKGKKNGNGHGHGKGKEK